MRMLDRVRIWATPALLLIAIGLTVAVAVKMHFISRYQVQENQAWLSAGSSVVSAGAILVTAVLAYFRFFRGRTFARRIVLAVEATVLTAPCGGSLHTVTTKITNVGTVSIWNPQVQVEMTETSNSSDGKSRILPATYKLVGPSPSRRGSISVLDSGETADFVCQTMVDRKVWAVTYLVTMRSTGGDAWSTVHAVEAHNPRSQLSTGRIPLWRWGRG